MRLRLLALLCLLAPRAAAQRVVVEAPAPGVSQVGALGSVTSAPIAPLVPLVSPLNLSVAPLSPSSLTLVPQTARVSAAGAANALVVSAALPASAIAPPAATVVPAAKRHATQISAAETSADLKSNEDAYDSGRAFFDEARLEGDDSVVETKPLGQYLRGDQAFTFDAKTTALYAEAKREHERSPSSLESYRRFLDTAQELLASAGVAATVVEKKSEVLGDYLALTIEPKNDGHRFNRLAASVLRTTGYTLEFTPSRSDAYASAHPVEKAIFLPSLELADSYEAILHETRHAHFRALLAKGRLSLFHPVLKARPGRTLSPNAFAYYDYMTLEEVSTYPKTLLHLLNAATRGDTRVHKSLRTYAFNMAYVLDITQRNMSRLKLLASDDSLPTRRLDAGKMGTLGAHWEAITVYDAEFLFPVRDEAPPPAPVWWKKPFSKPARSPGHAAAARYAESLLEMTRAMVPVYNALFTAVDTGDYAAAQKQALQLVAIADAADKKF